MLGKYGTLKRKESPNILIDLHLPMEGGHFVIMLSPEGVDSFSGNCLSFSRESRQCIIPGLAILPWVFVREFLEFTSELNVRSEKKISKAPVSQLVNADDTSVIEIKTQHYLES